MDIHNWHVIARILYFVDNPERCPNYSEHTDCPDGYLQWHAWADEMQKTHRARCCPGCGLFAIWTPIRADEPIDDDEVRHGTTSDFFRSER
jgi:hypothetical protein